VESLSILECQDLRAQCTNVKPS